MRGAHGTPSAFPGTTGHAFWNYLPVLPFLPVELVAQVDHDLNRRRTFARQFGAGRGRRGVRRRGGAAARP
jgi:hypothetical protein